VADAGSQRAAKIFPETQRAADHHQSALILAGSTARLFLWSLN
jgi:hypothetical protein